MKLRISSRARVALSLVGAAAIPAAAVGALLWSSDAATARFFPVEAPRAAPSPWLVAPADGTVPGSCQIAAVVVDEGSARAGVELTLSRVTADGSAEQWRALSDRRGVHRFLDLPAGSYQLTALAGDRMPAAAPEWRCDGGDARAFFTLSLAKADHVFAGRVTSQNGKPAPGAELAIAQELDGRTSLAGPARIPVDVNGSFSVRLAPGRYVLLAQAPHHASMLRKVSFDGSAAKSVGRFALVPAPRVTGRVVDENGKPVAGALVAAAGVLDPKQRVPSVTTEADGSFSLPVADGQDVVVTARAVTEAGGLVARADLGVVEGVIGFTDVDLVAHAGRSVEGFVTKPDGTPWAFGEVHYRVRDLGLQGTEKADAAGHFVLAGMPESADVEVWAEGNATGAWGAQVASPGNDKLALVYTPPAY